MLVSQMSEQILLLDRVEFTKIKIETEESSDFRVGDPFPQIDFDFEDVRFLTRSDLWYPPSDAEDPRLFALTYGIKLDLDEQSGPVLPYSIEVEAVGFFRYVGDDEYRGVDRFRAVRFSGFQILYGAIREMVCNLTARGTHGLWQLPARRFNVAAAEFAAEDEKGRLELVANAQKKKQRKRVARLPRAKSAPGTEQSA